MTIAELSPSISPAGAPAFVRQVGRGCRGGSADHQAAAARRVLAHLADALDGAGNVTELRRPSGAATCWSDVPGFLAERTDDLSPRDSEFIASMRDLIARGFTPTPKQAAWLRGLFARGGGCWAEEAA